ncbi:AraC family transcriptional regulator [Testudinibacter sp. TR-2022]|uniref:AraC family transcriptional regulator n=1 Tax=Testudinibacter sp. TR-2022 TaxID=2585029 RepID=UPI00111A976F|nr:AraC family transcriptional regulator [Testudinibacter sp. TR-2022]TNH05501.1 AraC family transcriptional regulator [Pasteurellaceae bacterium Phil11]TNH23180.1 AraC family transcriptional regulator [Testudinibacter sp. TR-2022]TNH23644.1 AraC family transcriptional regulator [Testudinibacter sp. TR-2022]
MFEPLIHLLKPHLPVNHPIETSLSGVFIYQAISPLKDLTYSQNSGLYFCLQGKKTLHVGKQVLTMSAGDFMLYPTKVPVVTHVQHADKDKPYISFAFALNNQEIGQILREIPEIELPDTAEPLPAPMPSALIEPLTRLFQLLHHPQGKSVLLPLIRKEIYYHLLTSPQGAELRRHIHKHLPYLPQINHAIRLIQENLTEPLNMEEVADQVGLSHSSFFRHFREITSISPLQYHKNLRLQKARELIGLKKWNIATIAYQVGYASPSQFSREYFRYFGVNPKKRRRIKI